MSDTTRAARPSLVFVFDFDGSLVVNDSDRCVAAALGKEAELKSFIQLRQQQKEHPAYEHDMREYAERQVAQLPYTSPSVVANLTAPSISRNFDTAHFTTWTTGMSQIFGSYTPEALTRAAADTVVADPVLMHVVSQLLHIKTAGRNGRPCPIDFFIASDANSAFISGVLQRHLSTTLEASVVHTNVCTVDRATNRTVIVPYAAPIGGHNCIRCNLEGSRNICKGSIVDYARRCAAVNCQDATVVYVGDGLNDHCALSHLRARDLFLVRRYSSLHRALTSAAAPAVLHDDTKEESPRTTCFERTQHGICNVVPWQDHEGLAAFITALAGLDPAPDPDAVAAATVGVWESPETTAAMTQSAARALRSALRLRRIPLLLFGEDGWSFRRVTLAQRMSATIRHTLSMQPRGSLRERTERFISALADELESYHIPFRGTLVPAPLFVPTATELLGPVDSAAGSDAELFEKWSDETGSLRDFWRTVIHWASDSALFPSPLASYRLDGIDVTQREEPHGMLDVVEWSAIPWLQGEILFHRALSLAFELDKVELPVSDVQLRACRAGRCVMDRAEPDHCALCNEPNGNAQCGCAFVHPSESEIAPPMSCGVDTLHVPADPSVRVSAPSWDQYRAEKAEMLDTTLQSHVALSTEAFLSRLVTLEASIHAGKTTGLGTSAVGMEFLELLLLNALWGNAVDLCLTQSSNVQSPTSQDESFPSGGPTPHVAWTTVRGALRTKVDEGRVVGDHIHNIAQCIAQLIDSPSSCTQTTYRLLDIVLDNAGVELAADLLLAVSVVRLRRAICESRGLTWSHVTLVGLHCKPMPWYVSDVVPHDVALLLDGLRHATARSRGAEGLCSSFAAQCVEFLSGGVITLRPSTAWTSALELREHGVELFDRFYRRSACLPLTIQPHTGLVIFKGDLNFRRVVGDRHWERILVDGTDAVPFDAAVEDYWPIGSVPIACLRTCKCELVCGVPAALCAELDAAHNKSRPTGVSSDSPAAVEWIKQSWRTAGTHAVALISGGP